MSDFYIYDTNRDRIGILSDYISVQWLEHYAAAGEVKIEAPYSLENLEMLQIGHRVYCTDQITSAVICQVGIGYTENGEIITVRANITSHLLDDRIVMRTVSAGLAESAMYSLYTDNRRGLEIEVGEEKGYKERADADVTWTSVLSALEKFAGLSGLGFRVEFNPASGTETLVVYKGVNRGDENSENYIGYFGLDVLNMANVDVVSGDIDFKNVAIVAGEGEGVDRVVRTVQIGTFPESKRRELYVDARDLQKNYYSGGQQKTYTDEEYAALLDKRGKDKLAEHLKTLNLSCELLQMNTLYGSDYYLGDVIRIALPEYGLAAKARVSSVTRTYEADENKVVATLDELEIDGGAS